MAAKSKAAPSKQASSKASASVLNQLKSDLNATRVMADNSPVNILLADVDLKVLKALVKESVAHMKATYPTKF